MSMESLAASLREFAREREWEQFHTPKNLAMALSGEAGELTSLFQWMENKEISNWMSKPENRTMVEHEMADVFAYLIRLADVLEVDLEDALPKKIEINRQNYPVQLARGNATKYTAFDRGLLGGN